MSKPTSNLKSGLLNLAVGVLLIGGATYYWLDSKAPDATAAEAVTPLAPLAGDSGGEAANNDAPTPSASIAPSAPLAESGDGIDVKAALKDRILGDSLNADIKISEHSSLTCGHCANFHRNTFAEFKAAYIDSGKAYLVYSDFPLNAPALQASMAARCLPEDKFFEFIAVLFGTQDDWAFDQGYLSKLKDKAKEFGMSGKRFDACVKNEELRDGIIARQQAAAQQWGIQSTPSFVVNNKHAFGGALSFTAFDAKIKEALSSAE